MKKIIGMFCAAFLFLIPVRICRCGDLENAAAGIKEEVRLICQSEDLPAKEKDYTVMIYMIGSNLESRMGNGTRDMLEMERAELDYNRSNLLVYTGGSKRWAGRVDSDFNSVLDFSRKQDNRLAAKTEGNVDMGLPETLAEFINFCTENYPAKHYALVFWDHGGGPIWGYGSDELFESDALQLPEMRAALKQTMFSKNHKLDWVGFDACLMGSLECMYLWSDYASYYVGSEELEPGDGWDYTFLKILNEMQDPEMVTAQIVENYGKYYEDRKTETFDPDVTLSAVNLAEVNHLVSEIGDFSSLLSAELKKGRYSSIQKVRTNTKSFGVLEESEEEELYYYDLVDLVDLAEQMSEMYPEESKNLSGKIEKAVTALYTNVEDAGGITLYYPSQNKSLYLEAKDTLDSVSISRDYSWYLSNLTTIWNAESSRDWDLGELSPGTEEYTLQLTEEQISNYSEIYYDVLEKTEYGYSPILSHCRIEPDEEGILHIPEDPNLFCLKSADGIGECWPVIQTENREERSGYHTERTRLLSDFGFDRMDEGDVDTLETTVFLEVREGEKDVRVKSVQGGEEGSQAAGKQTVDVSKWEAIYFSDSPCVPLTDIMGRSIPSGQWRKTGSLVFWFRELEENYGFELVPASVLDGDFYCQVILTDTQGEMYASHLSPVGQEKPYSVVTQNTEKGMLSYQVYEDHAELVAYEGKDLEILLPETINERPLTIIGDGTFEKSGYGVVRHAIQQITIPDIVEEIGDSAFEGCPDLTSIRLPAHLKRIGTRAFAYCQTLEEVTIPEGTESIGRAAFIKCTALKTVSLPASLKIIGTGAFMDCNSLEDIQVSGESEACRLEGGALYSGDLKKLLAVPGKGLKELFIPEGTEEIAYGAAAGSSIQDIHLPDSLKKIANYSFYGCTNLKVPHFPDSLEMIGSQAFGTGSWTFGASDISASQQEIWIPSSLSNIGTDAFSLFPARTFCVDPENQWFSSCEGHLTNKAEDAIIQFAASRDNMLVIPEGIVSFDWESIRYLSDYNPTEMNTNTFEIFFPDSVKIFPEGGDTSAYLIRLVFCGRRESEAERFANDNGIPYAILEDPDFFTVSLGSEGSQLTFRVYSDHAVLVGAEGQSRETELVIPQTVRGVPVTALGNGFSPVFGESSYEIHLSRVVIPDTVTEIKKYAFRYENLKELTLPYGLKILEGEALCVDTGEATVQLPESLEYIGNNCINSDNEYFTLTPFVKMIEPGAFSSCFRLKEFRMIGENEHYTVKNGMLFSKDEKTLIACPRGMEADELTVPDGTEVIGNEAFEGLENLKKVYIPESVRIIGESAFESCRKLEEIQFSEGLSEIQKAAFCSTGIKELICPSTLVKIGERAFMYCNSLEKVYLPDSLEIIGESSFDFCEDLMEVYFPDDLKVISNNAFSNCRKLANVELPAGLEYVGDSAFSDIGDPVRSGSLDSLLIGSKLNAIGDGPFGSLPCEIFIVDPENTEFSTVDGFLTDKTGRILLACPGGRKGEVHIPEGIEIIASYAFYFCSGITDLYLPESLSYIESIAFPDEFQREDPILFHVTKGSYGYQYARSEGLDYVL